MTERILDATAGQTRSEFDLLDKFAEDAIQIAHRMGGAVHLLKLHRKELDELRGRLADTAVAPESEPWKRQAIQAYAATLEQVDKALTALGEW
jgi:uncharacterized protein YukE